MKVCCQCKLDKQESEFHKDSTKRDGLSYTCKQCALERARKWYTENMEHAIEYQREYRRNPQNKDKINSGKRDWWNRNKEKARGYKREWKAANKERSRELNKRSSQKMRALYQDKVLSKKRYFERIRRARKYKLAVDFNRGDEEFCFQYWDNRCCVCGKESDKIHLDHWIPISYNGDDNPGTVVWNMLPLCSGKDGCNQSKKDRHPDLWLVKRLGTEEAERKMAEIDNYFHIARERKLMEQREMELA